MNRMNRIKKVFCCIAVITFTGYATTLNAQTILTLDKALVFAEQNSPDIQQVLFNLERSQQNLKAQRASLKSQFSLILNPVNYMRDRRFYPSNRLWITTEDFSTSGTFRVEQPILFTGGKISLTNDFNWLYSTSDEINLDTQQEYPADKKFRNVLNLRFDQPLFTHNERKLVLRELELDLENTNLSYAMQRLNLEKTVTQQFYSVYMAQMNLDISREELENTQKSYEIIKNKVDAGLVAKEELFQAELNLATAKSTLQNNEVSLENTKDDFKSALGMDIFEEIAVLADVAVNPVAVDMDKAIEHGLGSRMELRQREIEIEDAQFQLIRKKNEEGNKFQGTLGLKIGLTGQDERMPHIYDKPESTPEVSLSFSVPLFDWGRKKAEIKAQEATIKSSELSYSEEQKNIVINIRKVYRSLQNQMTQIEIAKQNVKNAELTYDINLERYENGDLTGMDLNLYQNQLSNKKISHIQALINYKIELLNMKVQSLFDFQTNTSIIPTELYLNE